MLPSIRSTPSAVQCPRPVSRDRRTRGEKKSHLLIKRNVPYNMNSRPKLPPVLPVVVVLLLSSAGMQAQTGASSLPSMQPTQEGLTAPLAATASAGPNASALSGAPQVTCAGGQLEIRAENSSLNSILRAVSRCTGMRITGHVSEQKVYGNYGPAAPATVLATLLDGTGSNMLLHETASDQPAELILTPRTGGVTPPQPNQNANADDDDDEQPRPVLPPNPYRGGGRPTGAPGVPPNGQFSNQGGGNQQNSGSAVTSPGAIPAPTNNPLGSPNNTSPTASTYPTTNSVPLDTVSTPSTVTSPNGIVDAPNPPAAGSDTAAALNGAPQGTPGTTNISPGATGQTSNPGGTNTTAPVGEGTSNQLTPEQIFQELRQQQQMQQQQQQQQQNPQ